jgi:hypothetical protein
MYNVKINDYNLLESDPSDVIALNTGKACISRVLNISGINGQVLKFKLSNDGENWSYVQNEEGIADFEVTEDCAIPLLAFDCLFSIESDKDPTGITASIGIKRKGIKK